MYTRDILNHLGAQGLDAASSLPFFDENIEKNSWELFSQRFQEVHYELWTCISTKNLLSSYLFIVLLFLWYSGNNIIKLESNSLSTLFHHQLWFNLFILQPILIYNYCFFLITFHLFILVCGVICIFEQEFLSKPLFCCSNEYHLKDKLHHDKLIFGYLLMDNSRTTLFFNMATPSICTYIAIILSGKSFWPFWYWKKFRLLFFSSWWVLRSFGSLWGPSGMIYPFLEIKYCRFFQYGMIVIDLTLQVLT